MAVTSQEDTETLLARSRAKLIDLWLMLKKGEIGRSELNVRMTDLLDCLESNHNQVYRLLQPDLMAIRQGVIGDPMLKTYQ